jgi:alpha-ketoglutarate-dependent taurine dioxygenase
MIDGARATEPYETSTLDGTPDGMPLVLEPRDDRDPERLVSWLRDNATWVGERLARHGAILLRGFDVASGDDFEAIARAIDPALQNEYLGTSPRNALTPSGYVFSASELPSYYPIMQHCEMTFVAEPPRHLFFCCLVAPGEASGETPLTDFRKVLRDVPDDVRRRLEERGLRIVRNYSAPGGGRFDLFQLKGWDEMFQTTDRTAVEERCRREGFTPTWTDDGGLRLESVHPITRRHPITGAEVWHNHLTTFHAAAAAAEYRRIHALRPTLRHWLFLQLARAMATVQQWTRSADDLSMHCTYADGGAIADADVEAVLDAVWRNLVVFPWRRGDVVAIDNYAVAHGRLPYDGPRAIAVCWA